MRKLNVLFAATLLLAACGGGGQMDHGTATTVGLNHNNYRVIKAGAEGSSSGFWFLFIPVASTNYASAKADLYRSVGQTLEGRSFALANETEDKSWFTLLLFTVPTLKVTADVIEFTDTPVTSGSTAVQTNAAFPRDPTWPLLGGDRGIR